MTWEGDQAVEECTDDDEVTLERRNAALKANRKKPEVKIKIEESDDGPSSEDEYVDDKLGKNKSADRVCFDVLKFRSVGLIHLFSVVPVGSLPPPTQPTRLEDGALPALKAHHRPPNMLI